MAISRGKHLLHCRDHVDSHLTEAQQFLVKNDSAPPITDPDTKRTFLDGSWAEWGGASWRHGLG